MKFSSINNLQHISMAENPRSHKCFRVCYLLHFSTLLISAASYDPPDHFFINCGSSSAVTVYGGQRQFAADNGFFFSVGGTTRAEDTASNLTSSQDHSLYRTARVFLKPSHYEFNLNETGIYVVRLHFSPFTYSAGNLSDARFSVFCSKFKLLSYPTIVIEARSHVAPLVEEFFIHVDAAGKLRIDFVPDEGKPISFAFINAIEAFLAPDSAPRVTPEVTHVGNYDGALKSPLRVVHRINVGGRIVMRETDKMFRYWVPDDAYLLLRETARNTTYAGKIEYQSGAATVFDAPDSVYNTAKTMNVVNDGNVPSIFNITWHFDVVKGAQHLVRLHFCDIVSPTSNEGLSFNLYIYTNSGFRIIPAEHGMQQLAVPFYGDYSVRSDDSGFMNISIGPNQESPFRTAFLNGVEIMEVVRDRGSSVPGDGDSVRKRLFKVARWGVAVAAVLLVAVILAASIICLRRNKWKPIEEVSEWAFVHIRGGSSHHSKTSRTTARTATGSVHADLSLGLRVPLSAILFATRKFNPKLMIGEGGFGKVYKGKMRDGRKVAVKRSEAGHGQGLQEFHTEINVLSKIRHQHLVSLIGYCDERNEMILVYEFMENGSLKDHLYAANSNSTRLSWEQRLKICIGAARGIHYLHTGCKETIVHRDIKSTNILLDEEYVAKVADFGLSRSGSLEQTHFSTEVKGSFGYLDPEYYTTLQLSKKSDVYSFGVVLLEVVCGRTAVERSLPEEQVNLADWGLSWLKKGQLECIVDPLLEGKMDPSSLRVFGETVERCLQECGGDRPHMSDVLWGLEYSLQFQMSGFPYEDSASLGLPTNAVRRLPSDSMSISEDEVAFRYCSFSDGSELGSGVVFSQLKIDTAR